MTTRRFAKESECHSGLNFEHGRTGFSGRCTFGSLFHPIPREWVLSFLAARHLAARHLALAGSFFTPLPPGKAEVLGFRKKD